ncbi:peptidoglycan-binding domain-containing protein [Streptomyces silvisoli]|uniref:Peptidoglycan-binding domain-containing protein n=1 Tax=Streptomyces silvisoli TaxID=3034235 RepID=A0ABT5ZS97_9ACTN|nr:peptidoglycan-binding domain-containing protein [Streptomyces silvisoli]MDF3292697.1 peptidoglycan-binding domain-containing protein [Streptomyces silvisoli]
MKTSKTVALTGLLGAALAVTTAVAAPATAASAHQQTQAHAMVACAYYDGNDVTSRGDTGKRVQEVQCLLNYWGYNVDVDGDFGPATEQAVRAFQAKRHLRADGIVGPRTWKALHGN